MVRAEAVPKERLLAIGTVRLIASRHAREPLRQLADNDAEQAVLEDLANLSAPGGWGNQVPLPAGVKADELRSVVDGFGWTYVNAAFCYTRKTGSRFNSPDRGAWYASYGVDGAETSKAELAWHLTRDLAQSGLYENTVIYREILANFSSDFHSLHGYAGNPFLDPDPAIGYPAGQALANDLRTKMFAEGVTYPSVRNPGGKCLAAFSPKLMHNVRHGRLWNFKWTGQPEPSIEEIPEP